MYRSIPVRTTGACHDAGNARHRHGHAVGGFPTAGSAGDRRQAGRRRDRRIHERSAHAPTSSPSCGGGPTGHAAVGAAVPDIGVRDRSERFGVCGLGKIIDGMSGILPLRVRPTLREPSAGRIPCTETVESPRIVRDGGPVIAIGAHGASHVAWIDRREDKPIRSVYLSQITQGRLSATVRLRWTTPDLAAARSIRVLAWNQEEIVRLRYLEE
jgi:hypothetical protein